MSCPNCTFTVGGCEWGNKEGCVNQVQAHCCDRWDTHMNFFTGPLSHRAHLDWCVCHILNYIKSQLCQYLSAVLGYNKIKWKQHCIGNIQIKSTVIIKKNIIIFLFQQEFFIGLGNTEKDMATLVACRIIFALIFQNCREVLPVNDLLKEMSGGLIWLDARWEQNQTCWPSSSVRNLALSSE